MYRVTIDRDACEGIFACLVRDDRFVEADDGLAGFDRSTATDSWEGDGAVVAEFDDDRIEQAREAAGACPPGAITVERIEDSGGGETTDDRSEEAACR